MNTKCAHGHNAPIALLKDLPITQAGIARHKCAVCAYEKGYLDGFKAALEAFKSGVPESEKDILSFKERDNNNAVNKIALTLSEKIKG